MISRRGGKPRLEFFPPRAPPPENLPKEQLASVTLGINNLDCLYARWSSSERWGQSRPSHAATSVSEIDTATWN